MPNKSSKSKSKKGTAKKSQASKTGGKKASKKASKKAASSKAGGQKAGSKSGAVGAKKSAAVKAGKGGAKGSAKGAAKGASKGSAAKGSGAKGVAATKMMTPAMQGNCVDISTAGFIVEQAIGSSNFDIDKTLEEMGLISDNMRLIFKQQVLNDVRSLGCTISDGDVPNDGNTTAREVRDAIHLKAGK